MDNVTEHLSKVFAALEKHGAWMTAEEIARAAGVAPRTARAHAVLLAVRGIVDRAPVVPHRFRFSPRAAVRDRAFLATLREAKTIFCPEAEQREEQEVTPDVDVFSRPAVTLHPFLVFIRERGITIDRAADELNVSERSIRHWVSWSRRPRRDLRERMARQLGRDLFPPRPA